MMGQLSACKCMHESPGSVHASVPQGESQVNAAKRAQVLLEKPISKCKLFCSQLGYVLPGQHQRNVGFY